MTQFKLTRGTTTLMLDGRIRLGAVDVPTPESKGSDTDDSLTSGGEHPTSIWRNVNQVIPCIFIGSYTEFQTILHQIETLFDQASDRQGNYALPRVFIELQDMPATDWWRSEILFGRVDLDPGILHWPFGTALKTYQFTIGIRRRFYWEHTELVQLPLKSPSQAKTTNAITVYSHTDATRTNYADVEAADVIGALPAPAHVYMYNTSGANRAYGNLWMSHNIHSSPSSFDHIIEGEEAEVGYLTQLPVSPNTSLYSGGYYNSRSITTTENIIAQWELSSDFLTKAAGQYFRVLMVLGAGPSSGYTIYSSLGLILSLTTLWQGPRVYWQADQEVQDLGVIQLPPYLQEAGSLLPLKLRLMARSSSSFTAAIDCFILQPTASWARLRQLGYTITPNDAIVYDGDLDRAYGIDAATQQRYNVWTRFGSPVMLKPGMDQRVYFTHTVGNNLNMNDPMGIKMYYRPRRLTL